MASTFTPNLNLQLQGVSDNSNTWGTLLNTAVFTNIDQALGSSFAPSVAGSSDYTLSQANSQNLYHAPSGVLTGNINYIFPANVGRILLFYNNTTGAFTVTVKSSGGTGAVVAQGALTWVFINSTGNIASTPFGTNTLATIASATTTDLGSAASNMVKVTGTTTITAFGSVANLITPLYHVFFASALTLTYNATSLILPGKANITTAANDAAIMLYLGSGNWQCLGYFPASGAAPVAPNAALDSSVTPAATTNTTGLMMGIGGAITPTSSGGIVILTFGNITNAAGNDGGLVQLRYGTGTAPVNGAAITGTAVGQSKTFRNNTASGSFGEIFAVGGYIPNLTVATAYWFDVSLASLSGGSASISNIDTIVFELK